ncbi:MAG: error-prone DNA polymerase [Acidobacteriota bacterium]
MFPELHSRSCFSFLAGASTPEALVLEAARLDMPAVALVDIDNLCGAPQFYMAAKKTGMRAHVGAEITIEGKRRLTLLAENRTGYQNLSRLITSMKLRASKGAHRASEEELRQYSEGLVCMTRGEAPLDWLTSIFGAKNIAVELRHYGIRDEEARNEWLVSEAEKRKLAIVACNAPHYATQDERELHDVLTCIRNKTTIAEAGQLLAINAERYLKSPRQMARLFRDWPDALAGARDLSQRLDFTLANLGYKFPPYPVPDGETMNSFLRKRTEEGARERFQNYDERTRKQIERELALIEKLDLAGYFLIVWDIVQFCRKNGILAQGRGSAANSAVCYALRITAVDPIALDLLFERFLSENRGEMPDIDIDLPSGDQRERVIQYVYKRYGDRGAAMTANYITYRGRSGCRDVGKVLGYDPKELDRLANCVSTWGYHDSTETIERLFASAKLPFDARTEKFMDLYGRIRSLPRHLGQHSGGMVICQGELDQVVPLEPATMPGRVVIQWDKEDCADLGLIKVDLLGLGMMAVLEESVHRIRAFHREEIDLGQLPPHDEKIFDDLQRADTIGLFQVESRAQMASLPLVRPEKFYDIVVQVAIIRPGPIVGNLYHPYVRRRQKLEPADALHPSLERVLRRTLGVPLFQEQLLRMAMITANFTGSEAEELRRALGFNRSEKRMRSIEGKLRAGMNGNNITGPTQDRIVEAITSFALYGFPESHAASFALLAYASAWLRCNYRAVFTAALLNNQPMGFYSPETILKDAQRHGLRVLPVDILQSEWQCVPVGDISNPSLRLGFNYIRGMREPVGEALVQERQHGPFTSIVDVTRRVPFLQKDETRRLAQVGAFNSLNVEHRRKALWQAEWALRPAGPLLDQLEPVASESPLQEMNPVERIFADFAGSGVTVGRPPVAFHRDQLNAMGVTRASDLGRMPHGKRVRIAGAVICRQRPGTAKGFAFYSLEDETGIANGIVKPADFEANHLVMTSAPYLMMEGLLQNQRGAISVRVERAEALHLGPSTVHSHDFR